MKKSFVNMNGNYHEVVFILSILVCILKVVDYPHFTTVNLIIREKVGKYRLGKNNKNNKSNISSLNETLLSTMILHNCS